MTMISGDTTHEQEPTRSVDADVETYDTKFRRRLDVCKAVVTLAGAAIAFFMLTRPDAVLNRSVSRENVRRERAKLLIDSLRQDDQTVRTLSLDAIESSYNEDDDSKWLKHARSAFSLREQYVKTSLQLADIIRQREIEKQRPNSEQSSAYLALLEQSRRANVELETLKDQLKGLNLQPPPQSASGAMGCVTLDVFNVTTESALLMGAGAGSKTREWFDFGNAPKMGFSVSADNGVGTVNHLQRASTYYFRYVLQNGDRTCFGDVKSFTTPR